MDLIQLKNSVIFLIKFSLGGLAIALVLLLLFPDRLLSNRADRQNNIPITDKNPVEFVSYHQAISRTAPAVTNVYATQILTSRVSPVLQDPIFRRFFGDPEPTQRRNNNLGSGVILDPSGYMLTNAHVVDKSTEIRVTLSDGRQAQAEIIGIDAETDLAVLRIQLDNLAIAPIGNSDNLKVGDVVLAIGNPYDFGQTVTQGIVSATRRNRLGINQIEDFIQTDAAINPGNSGGALINARGELVGINTAIFSRNGGSQGIGFAIPVDMAIDVMRQLITNGFVIRGWLGIEAQPVPADMAESSGLANAGVFVTGVYRDSPAARNGILPGDIISRINGDPLLDSQQAIRQISGLQPGEMVKLEIIRGWETLHLSAEVSQRPKFTE